MKKLAIAMPVHGRIDLTRRTINSILKHREYWKKEIQIKIFLGTNEQFYFDLADQNPWAITAVKLENLPLGEKFNKLCDTAADWGEYFVLLGSDDILSPDYYILAGEAMELNKNWAGVRELYLTNIQNLETRFLRMEEGHGIVGSGLLTRSEAWKKLREQFGDVYPQQNKELDGQAFGRYETALGKCWIMHSFRPLMLSVKSQENIWPFYMFEEFTKVDFFKLHDYFTNSDIFELEKYHNLLKTLEQYQEQ